MPSGVLVPYLSGWNMIGGPSGTAASGSLGPLYTYQAGDSMYETIPAGTQLASGEGYWAYFSSGTTATIPTSAPQSQAITLPPGQWVMISNSGSSNATVTGADVVYTYDGTQYQTTTSLAPGQGAWAISMAGGTATVANS
jgi:hypothetical protein